MVASPSPLPISDQVPAFYVVIHVLITIVFYRPSQKSTSVYQTTSQLSGIKQEQSFSPLPAIWVGFCREDTSLPHTAAAGAARLGRLGWGLQVSVLSEDSLTSRLRPGAPGLLRVTCPRGLGFLVMRWPSFGDERAKEKTRLKLPGLCDLASEVTR